MKKGVYVALGNKCGKHLAYRLPEALLPDPEVMPPLTHAVYVAVDAQGLACYVGSVFRPADEHALANHLREYLRDPRKTEKWVGVYVFPLKVGTPESEVRRIAGNIAGWTLPYDRERWQLAS